MKRVALALVAMFGLLIGSGIADARPHRTDQSGASRQSVQSRVTKAKKIRKAYRSSRSYRASRAYRMSRAYRATRAARVNSAYSARRAARERGDTGDSQFASLTGYGAGPRPRQWCGWWMRTQLGGGPAYNLAWNWRNYGSPTSAHVGAVVVWRHHVGMITGQASNGQWIVKSGNDSNRVRERARSVAGAIFRA